MGGQLPFDRHDWYVDRCGQEVRYVIDFYFHEDKAGTAEVILSIAQHRIVLTYTNVPLNPINPYTNLQLNLPCADNLW